RGAALRWTGRIDDHTARRLLAGALRRHAGIVGEGHVNHPALIGVHRVERVGLAGPLDTEREALGELADLIFAAGPIALHVKDHPAGLHAPLAESQGQRPLRTRPGLPPPT